MKIHSIFQSINGEVTSAYQGSVCTFIRMQGCSAGCAFCDTKDSQDPTKGEELKIQDIVERIVEMRIKTKYITITGGEPLEQPKELLELWKILSSSGYHITLETNGMRMIPNGLVEILALNRNNCIVMDYKAQLPGSVTMRERSFPQLRTCDWVKIPIQSKLDFRTALKFKKYFYPEKRISELPKLAFSAVSPVTPKQLMSWMFVEKVTDVVLNTQLHKILGVR